MQPQKHPILELKPLCEKISNPIMIKRENKKKKKKLQSLFIYHNKTGKTVVEGPGLEQHP